jgi:hypothetical protein
VRPAKRRRLAENLCHALSLPPNHPEVEALVRREIRNEARRSADFLWALARPDELLALVPRAGRGLERASTTLPADAAPAS